MIPRMLAPVLLGTALAWSGAPQADAPSWQSAPGHRAGAPPGGAPAHGRAGGGGDGPATVEALGIRRGTCQREVLGGMLGGAVGGVLGARIGDGEGRLAATAAGAVIGYLVGSAIGRSMDELDEACVGQALERAPDRRTVAWVDRGEQARYELTPTRTFLDGGRTCRDYVIDALVDGRAQRVSGTACRNEDGSWSRAP